MAVIRVLIEVIGVDPAKTRAEDIADDMVDGIERNESNVRAEVIQADWD